MKPALILAALFVAYPAVAETSQHGNIIFDVPAGWSIGGVDDKGTLTLLSDLPDDECEFCYVYIGTGTKTDARLDSFLFSQVTRFIDDDEMPEREVLAPPETLNAGGRPAAMMAQKVDGDVQILFAVKLFGRLEIMAFDGYGQNEAEVATALAVFQRDIAPMFEAARYVSEGAAPLMPPPEPGPLSGTFWGFSNDWVLGFDGLMKLELDHRFLTFWPDGTFYEGTPPEGSRPLDRAGLLDAGDMEWGSYAIAGDGLTLAFASGETEMVKLTAAGLEDGKSTLSKIDLLPDGDRIAGHTSDFFYSGFMPGSGVSGGISTDSHYLYREDGTFRHDRGASATGSFESGGEVTGGYATNSEDATEGTYLIRDGLIILTAHGKEYRRRLIYRLGSDIVIGELTLEE